MTFLARQERFERIGSTNDVVRGWLAAGTPEVCAAVADEQTAGRGRAGRAWLAPPGAGLLVSLGFRPAWLAAEQAWRLAAVVSLAMADAAEEVAGLRSGAVRLKWPNDLAIEDDGSGSSGATPDGGARMPGDDARMPGGGAPARFGLRKLGGVLGEAEGLGTLDPRLVVGIGLNADWDAADFPPELAPAMTSLRAVSGGRPIDRRQVLGDFLARLEAHVEALRAGRWALDDWVSRQATTGRLVRLEAHGDAPEEVRALGVDPLTGALIVADPASRGGERHVHAGEVVHVRLTDRAPGGDPRADRLSTSRAGSPAGAA